MMEVKRVIKGTLTSYYQVLMDGLMYDIHTSTNSIHQPKRITEGFHYQKILKNKLGRSGQVRVDITKLQEPYVYEATFRSAQGNHTLSYVAKEINEEYIEVQYEEMFTSVSTLKRMNHKIMTNVYKRSSIRKANQILDQLQSCMGK